MESHGKRKIKMTRADDVNSCFIIVGWNKGKKQPRSI